ncbi:hypothetical protein KSP40_PGU010451 [Platanthera guangdongensis]|uniref:Uncharacterized protein n=1 Tax=Platanthera guangdongensis TaxID=2320717 RepID=A0ABR2MRY2_9ASPA
MLWNRRRRLELALVLLSIYAARSGDIQPLDHGLSNEKDPDDPSPAMEEFFGARPAAPIPVVVNTIDPIWGVTGKVSPAPPASDGRRRREMLLVAGVACGVVGVSLLLAAAAYTLLIRRSAQPAGSQSGIGPGSVHRPGCSKSRREIRLGSGCGVTWKR